MYGWRPHYDMRMVSLSSSSRLIAAVAAGSKDSRLRQFRIFCHAFTPEVYKALYNVPNNENEYRWSLRLPTVRQW
jgi:hypothetical protein